MSTEPWQGMEKFAGTAKTDCGVHAHLTPVLEYEPGITFYEKPDICIII